MLTIIPPLQSVLTITSTAVSTYNYIHCSQYLQLPPLQSVLTITSIAVCPVLDDPANGTVTLTSLTTGGVAAYVCDPGFELVGEKTRNCMSNSEWSGVPPICRRRFILSHCSCTHVQ